MEGESDVDFTCFHSFSHTLNSLIVQRYQSTDIQTASCVCIWSGQDPFVQCKRCWVSDPLPVSEVVFVGDDAPSFGQIFHDIQLYI